MLEAARYAVAEKVIDEINIFVIDNDSKMPVTDLNLPDSNEDRIKLDIKLNNFNAGFGRANNQVCLEQHADYYLILNPDVTLPEDYIVEGINFMKRNPNVVLVTPNGKDSYGRQLHLNKRFPTLSALISRFLSSFKGQSDKSAANHRYCYMDKPRTESFDVECASGCCMLIKGEAFRDIQGFDPQFFLYFEDFDLTLRLKALGSVVYNPALTLTHMGGNTAKKALRIQFYFAISACKFFLKHGFKPAEPTSK